MAEPVILSWNPANWITIVLMVLLMYFILGAGVKVMAERKAKAAA